MRDLVETRPRDLSVCDLADHAGYSPYHFSRRFTARAGIGPGQYLIALRIDAAKRMLLAEESAAVIDVAAEVGFDSLSSFSRRFRSTVGIPPAALRRLAHRVADRAPRPFALLPGEDGDDAGARAGVQVELRLPADDSPSGDPSVWIGWYRCPAPIGLPVAGILVSGRRSVTLPLVPGAPWLLGFATRAGADPLEQLVPCAPMVAVHPGPITTTSPVTLDFVVGSETGIPLLSALPALCRS